MKALLVIVVVGLAGLVAYNVLTTGEVRLLPRQLTAEERHLGSLERELAATRQRVRSAVEKARASGGGAVAQLAAARREVERLEAEVRATIQRLEGRTPTEVGRVSARAAERARALERAVEAFKRELER